MADASQTPLLRRLRARLRDLLWWWLVPLVLVAAVFALLVWSALSNHGVLHIYARP